MSNHGHYKWDPITKTVRKCEYERPKQVNAPSIKTDEIAPLKHMGTGKYYTSMSKYRAATKAGGWEEVGDQTEWRASPKVDPHAEEKLVEAVTKAYYDVREGQAPLSELDKERCKIINKNLKEYNHDRRPVGPDGRPLD